MKCLSFIIKSHEAHLLSGILHRIIRGHRLRRGRRVRVRGHGRFCQYQVAGHHSHGAVAFHVHCVPVQVVPIRGHTAEINYKFAIGGISYHCVLEPGRRLIFFEFLEPVHLRVRRCSCPPHSLLCYLP